MRVAHVVPIADPAGGFGGPLAVAMSQASALSREGVEVALIGGFLRPRARRSPIPRAESRSAASVQIRLTRAFKLVPRSGFSTIVSPGLLLWLWREGRRLELVHLHAGRDLSSLLAALVCLVRRYPFVVQSHGMIPYRPGSFVKLYDALLTRPLLGRARRHFVLTTRESLEIRQILGPSVALTLLENGVPLHALNPRTQPRREVLFLGRLHERKQPIKFVRMSELLLKKNLGLKFRIVGPDEGSLPRVLEELGRIDSSAIAYEGALPAHEVLDRLKRTDIYVLPSRDEPFPMSLLEALSVGLPSVTTNSCGIADLLTATSACLVVDDDEAALADAVEQIVQDDELSSRLSASALDLINSRLSDRTIARKLLVSYCEFVA